MRGNGGWAAASLFALVAASGCATGTVGTVVLRPANAAPDEMAFGTGASVSAGKKTTPYVSDAVVVAAASDPHGPTGASEGDFVWQVRGGILQLCERADDGREDCRYATYTGFAPPPLLSFLPTIVEPGNLAGGTRLLVLGSHPVVAAEVAWNRTQSVPFVEDKAVWVTASTPALVGAQPVFLCSAPPGGPECVALPFLARRVLGSVVLQRGAAREPVLWLQAAENVTGVLGVTTVADLGVFRCEGRAGTPKCEKAKEIGQ